MPKTLIDIVKVLAAKAKITVDESAIQNEVPDEVFESINNSLLSVEDAKNNHPEIKAHYVSQALDRIDKDVYNIAGENKLPDEVVAALKTEKSSYARVQLLTRALVEAQAKKAAAGNTDKEKYAKEIADLNEALRIEKESVGKIKEEYEGKLKAKDMSYAKKQLMTKYKTIHDHLEPELKSTILDSLLEAQLKKDGYSMTVGENGQMLLLRADGNTPFGQDNKPLTAETYIDKVFSDNKQLVVNDPNAGQQQQRGATHTNGFSGQYAPGKKTANAPVLSKNEQALRDMEASMQQRPGMF
jgi:hypothetical protein